MHSRCTISRFLVWLLTAQFPRDDQLLEALAMDKGEAGMGIESLALGGSACSGELISPLVLASDGCMQHRCAYDQRSCPRRVWYG